MVDVDEEQLAAGQKVLNTQTRRTLSTLLCARPRRLQPRCRTQPASTARMGARLGLLPSVAKLAAWQGSGLRLICPGDTEWPSQLDDLGDARPLLLWARGVADVRVACLNSVSVVGARAATAYGNHVALEMAAAHGDHGLTVISGGAFGMPSQLAHHVWRDRPKRRSTLTPGRRPFLGVVVGPTHHMYFLSGVH